MTVESGSLLAQAIFEMLTEELPNCTVKMNRDCDFYSIIQVTADLDLRLTIDIEVLSTKHEITCWHYVVDPKPGFKTDKLRFTYHNVSDIPVFIRNHHASMLAK